MVEDEIGAERVVPVVVGFEVAGKVEWLIARSVFGPGRLLGDSCSFRVASFILN